MKRLALVVAALAMAFAAGDASAAWVCTAKNASGKAFSAAGAIKARVAGRALHRCRVNSAAPGTCYVASCT